MLCEVLEELLLGMLAEGDELLHLSNHEIQHNTTINVNSQ